MHRTCATGAMSACSRRGATTSTRWRNRSCSIRLARAAGDVRHGTRLYDAYLSVAENGAGNSTYRDRPQWNPFSVGIEGCQPRPRQAPFPHGATADVTHRSGARRYRRIGKWRIPIRSALRPRGRGSRTDGEFAMACGCAARRSNEYAGRRSASGGGHSAANVVPIWRNCRPQCRDTEIGRSAAKARAVVGGRATGFGARNSAAIQELVDAGGVVVQDFPRNMSNGRSRESLSPAVRKRASGFWIRSTA